VIPFFDMWAPHLAGSETATLVSVRKLRNP
jgi:hypothetical protein